MGKCCRGCCRGCTGTRPLCGKQCVRTILLCIAVVAGVSVGLCLRSVDAFVSSPSRERYIMYLTFPAELVVRLTTMLALPLIVTSLISSVPELDKRSSGKLGGSIFAYYLYTTIIAVAEGILFVLLINPGGQHSKTDAETPAVKTYTASQQVDAFLDMVRNAFPDNLFMACFQMSKTVVRFEENSLLKANESAVVENDTLPMINSTEMVEKLSIGHYEGMNILGLATFSLFFGVALRSLGPSGNHLSSLISTAFEALMKILMILMWTFPVTIVLMITGTVLRLDDPLQALVGLLYYLLTVLAGLTTHALFVLPLSYVIITRKNPLRFMLGLTQAVFTGFGTSNSLATLPITIDCVERNGVDSRVARLVLPLGASVNMDGTALYEAVAVLFVAQMRGLSPTPVQILIMSVIATVVSVGAPAMGGGLVSMLIVFQSLGLGMADLFLLLSVDFILSRFRTVTNLIGDAFCAGVISHVCRDALHEIDHRYLYDEEQGPTLMTFTARKEPSDGKVSSNQHTLTMENEDGEKLIITRL